MENEMRSEITYLFLVEQCCFPVQCLEECSCKDHWQKYRHETQQNIQQDVPLLWNFSSNSNRLCSTTWIVQNACFPVSRDRKMPVVYTTMQKKPSFNHEAFLRWRPENGARSQFWAGISSPSSIPRGNRLEWKVMKMLRVIISDFNARNGLTFPTWFADLYRLMARRYFLFYFFTPCLSFSRWLQTQQEKRLHLVSHHVFSALARRSENNNNISFSFLWRYFSC